MTRPCPCRRPGASASRSIGIARSTSSASEGGRSGISASCRWSDVSRPNSTSGKPGWPSCRIRTAKDRRTAPRSASATPASSATSTPPSTSNATASSSTPTACSSAGLAESKSARMPLDLGFLILLAIVAAGLGFRVLGWLHATPEHPSDAWALASPIGLGALALGVLGLAEAGWLTAGAIGGMLALGAIAGGKGGGGRDDPGDPPNGSTQVARDPVRPPDGRGIDRDSVDGPGAGHGWRCPLLSPPGPQGLPGRGLGDLRPGSPRDDLSARHRGPLRRRAEPSGGRWPAG